MTRQLWYVYYRRMFFKHINPSQVPMMAGAVVGACRANGWALDVQPKLLGAIFSALFNFDEDFRTLPAATIDAVAVAHQRPRRWCLFLNIVLNICFQFCDFCFEHTLVCLFSLMATNIWCKREKVIDKFDF